MSVSGKEEDAPVQAISNDNNIQIILPAGRQSFSISEVLQRLYAPVDKESRNTTVYITENISLQLMNTEW